MRRHHACQHAHESRHKVSLPVSVHCLVEIGTRAGAQHLKSACVWQWAAEGAELRGAQRANCDHDRLVYARAAYTTTGVSARRARACVPIPGSEQLWRQLRSVRRRRSESQRQRVRFRAASLCCTCARGARSARAFRPCHRRNARSAAMTETALHTLTLVYTARCVDLSMDAGLKLNSTTIVVCAHCLGVAQSTAVEWQSAQRMHLQIPQSLMPRPRLSQRGTQPLHCTCGTSTSGAYPQPARMRRKLAEPPTSGGTGGPPKQPPRPPRSTAEGAWDADGDGAPKEGWLAGWHDRVAADPQFVYKVLIEQARRWPGLFRP